MFKLMMLIASAALLLVSPAVAKPQVLVDYGYYAPASYTEGHRRGCESLAPLLWQCDLTIRRLRSSTLQLLFARTAKHFENVTVKT
ncbi:unnamed protein product [Arctia plantaginis]|uniref:Uncharacterized protein n=1 Tax=Arctia plantaginis TaxID=874455 RepID=A0A8S1AN51_ARCPL|nr:unnamed protein product [Arctia plantaginis]